jgi:hypothetical protein
MSEAIVEVETCRMSAPAVLAKCHASAIRLLGIHRDDLNTRFMKEQIELASGHLPGARLHNDAGLDNCDRGNQFSVGR